MGHFWGKILSGKKKEVEKIKEVKMVAKKRAKNPKWKEKRGGKKRGFPVLVIDFCNIFRHFQTQHET